MGRANRQGTLWVATLMALNAYLVEDSAVIRERLIPMLDAMADVQVVGTAETELDAARWLAANSCDLVLIDLLLRQGSGFGVLKRLQAMQAGSAAALRIVITNQATPEVRRRCHELGAAAVFDKSRELDELFDFLRARQEAPS